MNDDNKIIPFKRVFEENGRLWVTSLVVAQDFGKEPKHVNEAVKNLDCSEEFSRSNFRLSEYTDGRGKQQPMYKMTRDGFTFLAMGFTGKEAARFKEAYIQAFNEMERSIIETIAPSKLDLAICQISDTLKLLQDCSFENRENLNSLKTDVSNIQTDMRGLKDKICDVDKAIRRPVSKRDMKIHKKCAISKFNNICPCCGKSKLTNNCEIDHWFGPKWNKLSETWPICRECHNKFTVGALPRTGNIRMLFEHYQHRLTEYQDERNIPKQEFGELFTFKQN